MCQKMALKNTVVVDIAFRKLLDHDHGCMHSKVAVDMPVTQ